MKKVIKWYDGLTKRGKTLAIIGVAALVLVAVEILK